MSTRKKFKMITVDEQTYDSLRLLGHTPESFNDVIIKLIANTNRVEQKL
jgi:predicted CopG family antitoxin